MNWLLLTILAIFSRAIYGVSTKVLSSKVNASPATQSVIFSTAATLISLISVPFLGGFIFINNPTVLLMSTITILTMALGNITYYIGIKSLDSSKTQIAFSSILIWGTILSLIFLKSHFSIKQTIGIFILLCALILVQYTRRAFRFEKGIWFIILSAGLFAVAQISSSILSKNMSTGLYLILVYFGQTVVVGLIYKNNLLSEIKSLKNNMHQTLKITLLASITSVIYLAFAYFAYRLAPDRGVVVVLLTSQVIVAVILSIIFLKEREHKMRKLLAGVLAVIAGILIKG